MTMRQNLLGGLLAFIVMVSGAQAGPIKIVAAENFYGDIASQIGGPGVSVTSILANRDQDPHLFEASPSVARDVSAARIVICNGIGYDPWLEKLLKAISGTTTKEEAPDPARVAFKARMKAVMAQAVPLCKDDPKLAKDRPLLMVNPRAQWVALMEQRRPTYERLATFRVDTAGRTVAEVVDHVATVLTTAGSEPSR